MRKVLLLFYACLLSIPALFSQSIDFDNYQILKSTGKLPLDLSDYMKEDLINNDNSNKSKRTKKDERDFILQSTYSLNKLLRSGVVIYNDPVGEYLTNILQHVLKANAIDEDIRVYFIRSEEVNAYAMDKNFIFLTAGLLAQVTSEAQIAMILSHEYIHYRNKHSRTEYIENRAIVRDYRNYKTSSTDVRFLMASFSRDLETEADEEGFKLFSNSEYSYTGAVEAFEVLKFSYLPFEEIKYDKNFLESADLVFPQDYFLDELSPIEDKEDKKNENDEKYRTHPDIDKRIVGIQDMVQGKNNTGRKDFVISASNFQDFRKIARYELCRLYLIDKNYEEAFYAAYILLKENPNSLFLRKVVLRSLYGLSKYSNGSKFSSVHVGYKKKQGESQQVNYFMDALTKKEINYTAIHYAWNLHEQAKDDADVTYILNDLVFEACKYNKLTPYSLKTEHPDTNTTLSNDSTSVTDTTNTKKNKYNVIKGEDADKGKNKKKKVSNFIEYAFVGALKKDEFKTLIKDQYKKWEEEEEAKEEALKNKKKNKKYSEDEIDDTRDIESMLVLNPVILKVDMRSNENKIYNASSTKRKELNNNFVNLSGKAGITSTILNPAELTEDDADYLNDMSLLNTAMYEVLSLPGKINMLPTDNLDIKNLSIKYNTPYLANIGVLTFVEKKYGVALAILMGVVTMGFLLPYTIYVLAKPNTTTLVYMTVYDVEQNKFVFSDVTEIKSGGTQDLMGSTLYDMVLRMKKNK